MSLQRVVLWIMVLMAGTGLLDARHAVSDLGFRRYRGDGERGRASMADAA